MTYADINLVLSILAEPDEHWPPPDSGLTPQHTFMGVPVRLRVEWPVGTPSGFTDAGAVREWARRELANQRPAVNSAGERLANREVVD